MDVYFSLHTPGTSGTLTPSRADALRVFPNPASDVVFLENIFDRKNTRARILNLSGAVVWEGDIAAGQTAQVSTGDWPRGIYFVEVGRVAKKVVLR